MRIRGAVDPGLLRAALESVHRVQPGLRVTFHDGPGPDPVQLVHPAAGVHIDLADVSGEADPDAAGRCRAAELVNIPFDLRTGPVLSALLIRMAEDSHLLALSVAKIAVDGGSLKLVITDVEHAYRALAAGTVPTVEDRTGDFLEICARRSTAADPDGPVAVGYAKWIADVPRLVLPTDFPRPAVPGTRGAEVRVELGSAEVAALTDTARRRRTSLSPVLFAAYGLLLGRLSGQDRFLVGVFVAGRARPEEQSLIGRFANMLPMPIDLTDPDVVSSTSRTWWDGYDYHDTVVSEVAQRVDPDPPAGRRPLTDVEFMFNLGEPELAVTGEPRLTRDREPTTVALRDLTLFTGSAPGGRFELRLEYRTDLYREDTAWKLLRSYRNVLVELNT
jgi:hypothetical protein